jgi:tRNA U34 5-methylaminomethyl-2-thiouridine-forming methyltransferase MnmC
MFVMVDPMEYGRDAMSAQVSLPRTDPVFDAAAVVAAVRRGLASLAVLARPRFVRTGPESYFEAGLMRRELERL